MLEIRFHGRGGQGTVVATILMSKAFFRAGFQVQSFPFFGVERRGPPWSVPEADRQKILLRTNVYNPDHVVVLDKTLLAVSTSPGASSPGGRFSSTPHPPGPCRGLSKFRLAWVDASRIAMANRIGSRTHPIVNTFHDGGSGAGPRMPPLDDVVAAIRDEVPGDAERNVTAAREAYEAVHSRKP
jgi:pyruvate ferredoxin oxidoreductase gamma subunit/2-oxoisovalerate ferredoxin oxidoreductase gamma subunit